MAADLNTPARPGLYGPGRTAIVGTWDATGRPTWRRETGGEGELPMPGRARTSEPLAWTRVSHVGQDRRPANQSQADQTALTLTARGPLPPLPCSTSYSTVWPSWRESKLPPTTEEWWKNTSPRSPRMNPKPRSETNFLTVPCGISATPSEKKRTNTADPAVSRRPVPQPAAERIRKRLFDARFLPFTGPHNQGLADKSQASDRYLQERLESSPPNHQQFQSAQARARLARHPFAVKFIRPAMGCQGQPRRRLGK